MGNLGGGEVLVILLVALIVLGPTKLPPAIRQVGRVVGEMRRIGQGFQQELRDAAQPLQETKETLKATGTEFREATQQPIDEMKETLEAADKEFREATQQPIDEMKETLEAADKELRDAAQQSSEEPKQLPEAASSPDEPDSGPDTTEDESDSGSDKVA